MKMDGMVITMSNLVHHEEQVSDFLSKLLLGIPHSCHIRVHTCYHVVVPNQWEIRDRVNDDYHIVFIKGGDGAYTVGPSARSIPFERGKVIFVSRGLLHHACQRKENPPYIIPVRFGLYENESGGPLKLELPPFSFDFVATEAIEFQHLFEKLRRYYLMKHEDGPRLCGLVLAEILVRCCDELSARNGQLGWDNRVERVKRRMDEAPHARFTPDQLAEIAGLSEKYFRRIFKRQYGQTPASYQTKIRLEYARFLLAESGQSVKQVAQATGYPDPYSFSKQFKQWMGYPPSDYRSGVRGAGSGRQWE